MRVLVCGGRTYANAGAVRAVLDHLHRELCVDIIIQGGAHGADALAADWARARGVKCLEFKADWSLGKIAGSLRNAQMLTAGKPDIVVAFPGGRGTADMVRRAREKLVPMVDLTACM